MKTKGKRNVTSITPEGSKGSPLITSLRRWRVLDASESFRRFLSPNWDLPERLASSEKTAGIRYAISIRAG